MGSSRRWGPGEVPCTATSHSSFFLPRCQMGRTISPRPGQRLSATHTLKSGYRPIILCRARAYRPQLEALEARLPLGDVLLGAALGSSLLGSGFALHEAESAESGSVRTHGAGRRWQDLGRLQSVAKTDRSSTPLLARPSLWGAQPDSHADRPRD